MGHLLSTVNPEAAAEADNGWKPAGPPLTEAEPTPEPVAAPPRFDRLLPSIGNIVVYHLREGDSRNRRTKFPAIVMDSDQEWGTLKLWIIVDDGDTWMQERVPAQVGREPGWELVTQTAHQMTVPEGFDISGWENTRQSPQVSPPPNLVAMIAELSDRVAALEAKRGPGRPPSNKPKE